MFGGMSLRSPPANDLVGERINRGTLKGWATRAEEFWGLIDALQKDQNKGEKVTYVIGGGAAMSSVSLPILKTCREYGIEPSNYVLNSAGCMLGVLDMLEKIDDSMINRLKSLCSHIGNNALGKVTSKTAPLFVMTCMLPYTVGFKDQEGVVNPFPPSVIAYLENNIQEVFDTFQTANPSLFVTTQGTLNTTLITDLLQKLLSQANNQQIKDFVSNVLREGTISAMNFQDFQSFVHTTTQKQKKLSIAVGVLDHDVVKKPRMIKKTKDRLAVLLRLGKNLFRGKLNPSYQNKSKIHTKKGQEIFISPQRKAREVRMLRPIRDLMVNGVGVELLPAIIASSGVNGTTKLRVRDRLVTCLDGYMAGANEPNEPHQAGSLGTIVTFQTTISNTITTAGKFYKGIEDAIGVGGYGGDYLISPRLDDAPFHRLDFTKTSEWIAYGEDFVSKGERSE